MSIEMHSRKIRFPDKASDRQSQNKSFVFSCSITKVQLVIQGAAMAMLLLLLIPSAMAQGGGDSKVLPGSVCAPISPSANCFDRNGGAITSICSSDKLRISCPVVRDNTLNTTGSPGVAVRALVRQGLDIECKYVNYPKFSGQGISSSTVIFHNPGPNPILEVQDFIVFSPTQSIAEGSYVLECEFPPRGSQSTAGSIASYQAGEYQ